jgi:GNAT superfamily N-acetyltransferase
MDALNPRGIVEVTSDDEILATRAVMLDLRPHVRPDEYVQRVRRMMTGDGYRLVALRARDTVWAVAGYRVLDTLIFGRVLYVDDLNTHPEARSQGLGRELLDWLKAETGRLQCDELQLDSGLPRTEAHRFYLREGLTMAAYHFRWQAPDNAASR